MKNRMVKVPIKTKNGIFLLLMLSIGNLWGMEKEIKGQLQDGVDSSQGNVRRSLSSSSSGSSVGLSSGGAEFENELVSACAVVQTTPPEQFRMRFCREIKSDIHQLIYHPTHEQRTKVGCLCFSAGFGTANIAALAGSGYTGIAACGCLGVALLGTGMALFGLSNFLDAYPQWQMESQS